MAGKAAAVEQAEQLVVSNLRKWNRKPDFVFYIELAGVHKRDGSVGFEVLRLIRFMT